MSTARREGGEYLHILKKYTLITSVPSAIQPIRILTFSLHPLLLSSSLLISCLSFINISAPYTLLNFTLIHLHFPCCDKHPPFVDYRFHNPPATRFLQTIPQECAARHLSLSTTTTAEQTPIGLSDSTWLKYVVYTLESSDDCRQQRLRDQADAKQLAIPTHAALPKQMPTSVRSWSLVEEDHRYHRQLPNGI